MKVFDVSSPSGLVESGSTAVADDAQGIALSGDYAFLAAGVDGLQVDDISDPISPTAVLTHSVVGEADVIWMQGTTVYLGLATAQILPVDVTAARNPVDGSAYTTSAAPMDIALSADVLYTANGWEGLQTIPVTNPSLGGSLRLPNQLHDLAIKDSYAFGASDALFNLGGAFSAVQALPKGVYITMNGKIFTWNNVRKNKESGDFEEISH